LSPCSPLLLFSTSPSLSPCSPLLLAIPDDRYIAVPGMSIFGKQRCRFNGRLVNGVDPKSITRFEVFPPGSICDKVDITVTMKSGKQICVNPNSKMVKNILSGSTKNGGE
uniref:Chemokine interleukin-8-like domain-containing protein n=1 Tax=Leptobrachium leishanense TaxID=445787 RepID=A0A8C5N0W2_9ANUR